MPLKDFIDREIKYILRCKTCSNFSMVWEGTRTNAAREFKVQGYELTSLGIQCGRCRAKSRIKSNI